MKLSEHYVHLYQTYTAYMPVELQEQGKGQSNTFQTKIEDIQTVLCCTKRHTKWLLKELQDKQWIQWEAVRGRGKSSRLTFLLHPDEVKVQGAKELVLEGKYDLALRQLENVDHSLKEQFHHWLSGQLGYMIEVEGKKELDVLRYAFYPSIVSLDPVHILSRHDSHIVDHVFDPLVRYDDQEQKVVPHLAHYWEADQTGKAWSFFLRKGIKFHHGRELTAQDVVQTFQRFQQIKTSAYLWKQWGLESVEAPHAYLVRFTLKEPDQLFPQYLSYPNSSIIPLEVWEKDPEAFGLMPIGTGPFKVIKHDKTMLALEAFDFYFKERVQLDRVEILTLPELFQEESQLINYRYDFGAKPQNVEDAVEDKRPWIRLERMEDGASYYICNLLKDGPQQNFLFRKSLYAALPISQIATDLGFANYIPSYSFFTEISKQHPARHANLEQAKIWLKKSGYKGELIRICATQIRPKVNFELEMNWLQKQWTLLGIKSEVQIVPIYQLAEPEFLADVDIVVAGVAFGQSSIVSLIRALQVPRAFISPLLDPTLKQAVDETIQVVKKTTDTDLQQCALIDLEKKLTGEHALHFLRHRSHSVEVRAGSALQGVSLNHSGRVDYTSLWFKPNGHKS